MIRRLPTRGGNIYGTLSASHQRHPERTNKTGDIRVVVKALARYNDVL
jgi:hypothetical protein